MTQLPDVEPRAAQSALTSLMPTADMPSLTRGRFCARLARCPADFGAIYALRARAFRTQAPDRDAFDEICAHMLIEDRGTRNTVCCFRILLMETGRQLPRSYASQFYDLSRLQQFPGRMVEMGRFCIDPDHHDPDILRLAWGALTAFVDQNEVQMLFGCSSFAGTRTADYLDAFALLKSGHLAPQHWSPGVKAPDVFRYAARLRRRPDTRKAMRAMPPLLKTYLIMGGWVSDHAVVDHQMDTLHVFTGVEICAIPDARKRLLRAVAG